MAEAATGKLSAPESRRAGRLPGGARGPRPRLRGELLGRLARCSAARRAAHLLAIYGYARLVDQIGDAVAGDRLAAARRASSPTSPHLRPAAEPRHPVLRRLAPTVRALDLPRGPFLRLIEANRRDQVVVAYATFEELARLLRRCRRTPSASSCCTSSARRRPTGSRSPTAVCTALQLAEHWQDVAEDYAAGRIYLPAEDLDRFGVGGRRARRRPPPAPALRELIAFEVARARALLDEGAPLVGRAARAGPRSPSPATSAAGGPRSTRSSAAGYDVLAGAPTGDAARARARATLATSPEAMTVSAAAVAPAYEHCRRLAREAGSSFYTGMRLLPPERRDALFRRLRARAPDRRRRRRRARRRREARRARRRSARALRAARRAATTRCCVARRRCRAAAPDPARRPSAISSTAPSWTSAATPYRDVRGARALLPARRRLDRPALARRVRLLRPRARRRALADELGVALQIGNILRDVGEDAAAAASTCPARISRASAATARRRRVRPARSSS